MDIEAAEAAAHFQVLGEILKLHLSQPEEKVGVREGQWSAEIAAWFLVLQRDNFEFVIKAFTSALKHQTDCPKEDVELRLRKECSKSGVWAELCAFQVSCTAEPSLSTAVVDPKPLLSAEAVQVEGSALPEPRVLFDEQGQNAATAYGGNKVQDAAQSPVRQENEHQTQTTPEVLTNTGAGMDSDCFSLPLGNEPLKSDATYPPDEESDSEPEDSTDCFIRKETLEALASEAESLASASPGSPKQSPWKPGSPQQYSYTRFGPGHETPEKRSPGMQSRGFWDRMKQGFSDRPKAQVYASPASPERELRKDLSPGREPSLAAPSKPAPVDSHKVDPKASPKLLRTYLRSRARRQSLCKFLEAAGPTESDDMNKIHAWSWLLFVTASSLRAQNPYRPQLRYLLRVADHVSDVGWPAPPAVLLVLRDKLGSFNDTTVYALLKQKEKALVKSFAERLAAIARTILEWYFLHPASRVRAALDVGSVQVSSLGQDRAELLSADEVKACLTAAAQDRYTKLRGQASKVTKQILLAFLSRNVTAELCDQMQSYPPDQFPVLHPVRIASATFCSNLLVELQSLETGASLEVNRDFFTLFEALLQLDLTANRPQSTDVRISNLPNQAMSPFLAGVCQVLEPYVNRWISSLSDQLLRWDQSLVVSLAKQTPLPGSKGRSSRSLRDLFDGILRIVGSENARLVYRSAPRYSALLDKSLCRVILNRTQAIHVLCQKALSQAAKQYYLPLPPALKKWRLPATGPLLSPHVCVLLNDMREIRSRFSTLVADITAAPRESSPSTLPLTCGGSEETAVAREPPKPPKEVIPKRARGGFLSRLWEGKSAVRIEKGDGNGTKASDNKQRSLVNGAHPSEERPERKESTGKKEDERNRSTKRNKKLSDRDVPPPSSLEDPSRADATALRNHTERNTSGFAMSKPGKVSAGSDQNKQSAGKNGGSKEMKGGEMGGDTSLLGFREAVARSLSAPERALLKSQKSGAEGKILRAVSVAPDSGSCVPGSQGKNGIRRLETGGFTLTLSQEGTKGGLLGNKTRGKKETGKVSGVTPRERNRTEKRNGGSGNGTEPAEPEELWAEEVLSTSEERFTVLRMEIEKQYRELVRSVAKTITQDFAPFLEAVILGPDYQAPANPALPRVNRGMHEPSDFGLALDARRRMKPLLDYIMETFQDGWNFLDRSVLRRLARDTWDSSAEALLSLLPSFHVGSATNIAGRLEGPVDENDDLFCSEDGHCIDLSSIDEAAPRLRKVGAVSAHLDEMFRDLIVSASSITVDSRNRVALALGKAASVTLPPDEVPRNVRKLRKVLDAFAGTGNAASWSSTSYVR